MEYQKIIDLLDRTSNQWSKFRTKNWIEINDQSRGVDNTNSHIRFTISLLKSSLCDYSDACIHVKGTITIIGAGADAAAGQIDERNKGVILTNCAQFINCKSEINNTETDNEKDTDKLIPMYNLLECSDSYSNTSRSLWQYSKGEPSDNLADSKSFKSKVKITGNSPADGSTKDVERIVSLEYLSNFRKTLEMPLINCEDNITLTWSSTCVITNSTGEEKFAMTDTKLYVLVVTLSTQGNTKFLQQLKSGFKRTINWDE